MTRPMIEKQITFLYTPDLANTARFYEEVMGLSLKLDQGTCRIYSVGHEAFIGFCQQDTALTGTPESKGRQIILTLVTPEVDEWYHYLGERGVVFEQPPEFNPKYDIYHCFLRDPDGYLIEIQRFQQPF